LSGKEHVTYFRVNLTEKQENKEISCQRDKASFSWLYESLGQRTPNREELWIKTHVDLSPR